MRPRWNLRKIEGELKRLGWNKSRLAKEMKMSRQAIHQYLYSKVTIYKAERVAGALGLDTKDLLI